MAKHLKYVIWLLLIVAALFLFLRFAGNFFVADFITPKSDNKKEDVLRATIGKEVPYFNLSKISGGSINRSDIAGTPTILVFWATWNSEAADQIKILDDYLTHSIGVPARVIAVDSQEDRSAVSSFIRRGGYSLEVLLDQTGELSNRYSVQTLPTTFFIDKSGVVRDVFVGVMSEAMLVDNVEKMLQ